MKTLFAFLGLFMFASVSSTDISENNIVSNEATLLESGNVSTSPRKKADLVMATESGNVSTSPRKKADLPMTDTSTDESGNVSTSPRKKADLPFTA